MALNVKVGMQQAPHRSLFNALGFTEEEMRKLELAPKKTENIINTAFDKLNDTDFCMKEVKEYPLHHIHFLQDIL